MDTSGHMAPLGSLGLVVLRGPRTSQAPLVWHVRNWAQNRRKTIGQAAAARIVGKWFSLATMRGALHASTYRAPWAALAPWQAATLRRLLAANHPVTDLPRHFGGMVTSYGVLGRKVVTDTGVGYIVDAFQNLVELENMKYHGFGTGTGAEAAGDTALGTEFTTEYATNSTRPTGTTSETSANIYSTVATFSPDSGGTLAVTEHGVFSATSAGVLLDRTKFSAVNLVSGSDSLQSTYTLTLTSGS